MRSWPFSDERLRAMYAGPRTDRTGRILARIWAATFRLGVAPRRWVTLGVIGRRSRQPVRFPLGMADWNGQWYLVSMLGERCNWVKNVHAAGGRVTLSNGRTVECHLTEVPPGERAPIIKRYLQQVPGARPHIPVGQHASLDAFETIAPDYPVFLVAPSDPRSRSLRRPAQRRAPDGRAHRWWRWIVAGTAAILILAVLATIAFIKLQPAPAALSLPSGAASAPSGPLGGTWTVGRGSAAGFRIQESAFGVSNVVVGRTSALTGSVVIAGSDVTSATFRIRLDTITVAGKAEPQLRTSLDSRAYPLATISLTQPLTLTSGFAGGSTVHVTVAAQLTLRGTTRPVTVTLSARRAGSALQATGTIPVEFSRWGIEGPAGFGFLASLANHGTAEFLVVLHRH